MAKEKTREEYRHEAERLNQWCDFLAKMLDEKSKDLDNALNENAKLKQQIVNLQTQQPAQPTPARPEPEPTAKRPGRKVTISDTDRQYIHELYKAVDGDGKRLHSVRGIADHVGISKSRVAEILQEPEKPGRWYATDPTGNRTYYSDYHAALQSGKHIDYEVTA